MSTRPLPTNPDIVLGGKQFKQPNPPVRPKWDTEPADTEPLTGGAKMNIGNAAPLEKQQWAPGNTGLSGIRKNPVN